MTTHILAINLILCHTSTAVYDRWMVGMIGIIGGLLYLAYILLSYSISRGSLYKMKIDDKIHQLNEAEKVISENKARLESLHSEFRHLSLSLMSTRVNHKRIFGSYPDTICSLVQDVYDLSDSSQVVKNQLHSRFNKNLKEIKSDKFLNRFLSDVDECTGMAITRFSRQLPDLYDKQPRLVSLVIGGLSPQSISLILNMKIQTFYTTRNRYRTYIANSNACDKEEFLGYFA